MYTVTVLCVFKQEVITSDKCIFHWVFFLAVSNDEFPGIENFLLS